MLGELFGVCCLAVALPVATSESCGDKPCRRSENTAFDALQAECAQGRKAKCPCKMVSILAMSMLGLLDGK